MTIVGIEIRKDGERQLLVLDPGYQVTKKTRAFIEGDVIDGLRSVAIASNQDNWAMSKPYRRGKKELGRYDAFETLRLVGATQFSHQAPA